MWCYEGYHVLDKRRKVIVQTTLKKTKKKTGVASTALLAIQSKWYLQARPDGIVPWGAGKMTLQLHQGSALWHKAQATVMEADGMPMGYLYPLC